VNPQWHDEFVALCALFPSGELTEEEWALLQVHLAYCDSCRMVFEQYQRIASEIIPAMASSAILEGGAESEASSFSLQVAEKRLMSRLDSVPVDQTPKKGNPTRWQTYAGALAACVAVAAGLIGLYLHRSQTIPVTPSAVVAPADGYAKPDTNSGAEIELRSKLEHAEHKVTELQLQIDDAENRNRQSSSTVTNIQQQLETERAERKKISDEREVLTQQLTATQTEEQSLRDKSAAANVAVSQQSARLMALEVKLRDMSTALDEKDRMLALDKEFQRMTVRFGI
jgi:hypothetical protein